MSTILLGLINIYTVIIIVDTILSYLPQFRKNVWAEKIKLIADFSLKPVRKWLPQDLPFDASPLVVFFALRLIVALW